jgi:hypothetical protein
METLRCQTPAWKSVWEESEEKFLVARVEDDDMIALMLKLEANYGPEI